MKNFSVHISQGIHSIPESILRLTQLRELGLSKNQLTQLLDTIENLSQLEELNLRNNLFTEAEKEKISSRLSYIKYLRI